MRENIELQVRDVLQTLVSKRLAVRIEDLRMDANFVQDLGADSLDMVDIVLSLEEQLKIKISEQEIVHLSTVGDAICYLAERIRSSGATAPDGPDADV